MKIASLIFILLSPSLALAQSQSLPVKQELKNRQKLQREAKALFEAGRGADAVVHLRANVRAEAIPDGDTAAFVQSLVELSSWFRNQGLTRLARDAAGEAFVAADSLIKNKSNAPAWRRAQLFNGLGLLCENVLYDLGAAAAYYDAAAALDPAQATPRARIVKEKLKRRNAPGKK